MKFVFLVLLLLVESQCFGQKYLRDSLNVIFQENKELRTHFKELELNNVKLTEKIEALKHHETLQWSALGIIVGLLVAIFGIGGYKLYFDTKQQNEQYLKETREYVEETKKILKNAESTKQQIDIIFESLQEIPQQNSQENDNSDDNSTG
jgi:Tfp pilus assembly protein PilN